MTAAATAEPIAPDAPADEFPCETFKDAARHMRRPFTAAAVKFKVQATWPKDNPTGGLIVAYIDARLAVERLNLLVPHLWHDAYRPVGQGQMWCDLTIDGITRSDVGEGIGKGLVSDSLKRAAVKFGIGVSLYAIPKMILNVDSGAVKQKNTSKGKTLELTATGEQVLRDNYEHWLDAHGREAFGEPLNHGDVNDAQGDPDADVPADVPAGVDARTGEVIPSEAAPSPEAAEPVDPAFVSPSQVRTIYETASALFTHLQLANLAREVKGDPPLDVSEPEAAKLLDAEVRSIPADKAKDVLAKIAKARAS